MKRIDQVLPPMLERIAANHQAYRAERIARFGWRETISCPACGDTGTTPEATLSVCRCDAGEQLTAQRRRHTSWEQGIPRAMRGWTLATAPDRVAAEAVGEWLEQGSGGPSPNVILRGDTGTGKTGLAIAALAFLCGRDVRFAFHVVADLLDTLRPGTPDAVQAATMRHARQAGVTALDDLGAERLTDFALERLYVVLNHRMNAALPTIITTNLSHDLLRGMVGERLMRRITQDGAATEIVVRRRR